MASRSYKLIFTSDTSGAVEGIQALDKEVSTAQYKYKSLVKDLNKGFNADKFQQAQESCQTAIKSTNDKLKVLKDQFEKMENEGISNKNKKAFNVLKKEIADTEAKAEKFKKQLENLNQVRLDSIKKTLSSISDTLDKAGKKMTTFVTLPIVAGGAASVKLAADMEESINKVEVVFGNCASVIEQFSNTTLTTYGIAKSSALEMASAYGDMATSMGASQIEAANMAKTLVGLTGDLASFKNFSIDEVQTALTGIFTGETESLKRLAVTMTEDNLKAYALSQGIQKNISDMTQYEKVQLRMQYVLSSTANSQGDFARTSDSTANQLRVLTESLKDLAAIAGEELIPIILPIIQKINDIIQRVGQLDDGTKQMITKVVLFVAALGPCMTISSKLVSIITTTVTAYHSLKSAHTAATVSQIALNTAMQANPIGAVASAIGILVSLLGSFIITSALTGDSAKSLSESIDDIKDSTDSAIDSIEKNVTEQEAELAIVEKLASQFENLNKITNKTASEKRELQNIVNQINGILPDTIALIDEEAGKYEVLGGSIQDVVDKKRELIQMNAATEKAEEYAAAQIELLDSAGVTSRAEAEEKLKEYENGFTYLDRKYKEGNWFSKFFRRLTNKYGADYGINSKYNIEGLEEAEGLKKLIEDYDEYDKKIESLLKVSTKDTGGGKDIGGDDGKTKIGDSEAASEFLSKIEYRYKIGEDSYETYLNNLKKYRDDYFVENSSGWRSADLKIRDIQAKHQQELESQHEETIKKMLSDFKEYTDEVISLAEKQANAKIAAIDAELEAREKLKESQNQQLKLEQAMAQLAFTTDESSRKSLQREIKRLKSEIEESKIQSKAEEQKAAIQAQLDNLKSQTSGLVSSVNSVVNSESTNQYTANLSVNTTGLTPEQAAQMIQEVYNKILYNI